MMDLNPSTYYYHPKVSREERAKKDADLRDKIEFLQTQYSAFGYRPLHFNFQRHFGIKVNGKKIRRIMRENGLFKQIKRRFVVTTDSNHAFPICPNLIRGREVTGLNQVWVADITYIRILTGFVFLAVILDVYSRRVIGWALAKTIDRKLSLAALRMAIAMRGAAVGLIHHSDRGGQYACEDYVDLLNAHSIKISMSAPGNPYENAFAESFMKTLKQEEVNLWEYTSFSDVVESVPRFIEAVYNRKRLHSGINYLPPAEFETILDDNNKQSGRYTLKISDF
jgi:transposase InsO family protein